MSGIDQAPQLSAAIAPAAPVRGSAISARLPLVGRIPSSLLLATAVILPLLLCLPFIHEPFERDEGAYATVAQGMLSGDLPYRDLFDHKPPLAFAWYAASFVAFGDNVEAPHLAGAIALSVTALLVIATGRTLFTPAAGNLAGIAFGLAAGLALLRPGFNTETFMLPWMVGSLWAFAQGERGRGVGWYALAGGLGAVAILTKSVAVFNLAFLAGVLCWDALRHRAERASWLRLAALMASAVTTAGLVALPFVLAGALGDFLYANVHYNILYAAELPFARSMQARLVGLVMFLQVAAPLVVSAGLGIAAAPRRSRGHWLLLGWAAASAAGVLSTGHFALHYFQQLLPALALMTGLVAFGIRFRSRTSTLATAVLFAVAALSAMSMNAPVYLAPTHEERLAAKEFNDDVARHALLDIEIAAYIRANTSPDETIFNFGRESQIYFYSERAPAVRYFYDRPFVLDPPTLASTLHELQERPPAMIVETGTGLAKDPEDYLAFRDGGYEHAARIGTADVYRRR